MSEQHQRIGEILIGHGVPREYIELALKEQRVRGNKLLGEILLEMSLVNSETLAYCLAKQWKLNHFSLFKSDIQEGIIDDLGFIEEHGIVPIEQNGTAVRIGMVNPKDYRRRDAVHRYVKAKLGKHTEFSVVSNETFQRYLESLIRITDEEVVKPLSQGTDQSVAGLRLLLKKGIIERCSDIHIEPAVEGGRIKMRRNGILGMQTALDPNQYQTLMNIIRVRSGMNLVEKQMPQDGRIEGEFIGEEKYKPVDFRVSLIPNWSRSGNADSVVIRILDRRTSILPLEELGMNRAVLEFLNRAKNRSHGIIIFTGPTGSGKSTSIYSAMATVDTIRRAVVTVEDPVEYRNYLWKQIQITGNLKMADALRSILRHDPDIIFCGEIRDEESAKIAFDTANTGHLVFTTLHANDSIKAIPRLQALGIPNSMIEATVLGIVSQRLARVLCSCKAEDPQSSNGDVKRYRAVGCPKCNHTGYKGRTMIAEHFPLVQSTREALQYALDGNIFKARESAGANGIHDLLKDADTKLDNGIISVEERERVI
ncbi:MAG: Flp pilus assembly complex ATPase component TadA [Alphaproteobacteria bacterium]|uniref:Flp pilus assembly complex ATPase component TadA n=1 Tax=Candidatus Nitrobium versatile TaxID=2884831 RepID=A0A953JE13_9BACT|nr:Flp pilus assembly complex ATPase component TadA [Candidatus Nitrobium versatile]